MPFLQTNLPSFEQWSTPPILPEQGVLRACAWVIDALIKVSTNKAVVIDCVLFP
ncbi:hypothetical protein [Psychrobacter sp. 72-O-c]|uniref:hypothetical protein n=1 Tax=Psychrobacter sp. 72-O-c TaxID=2774125 RepID=UPI0019188D42|nr:hypothetical protein [Psychrobacter sp. 72-O-c]